MGQARDLVDQWWQAFESGDLDAASRLMAPDCEFVEPGIGLRRGPQELRQVLESYLRAFPDLHHEVVDTVESGDRIALELRFIGTHTGPLGTPQGDVPPSGRHVVFESVDFIRTEGGKIKSWHVYLDQVAFLSQLGLMPST